jgi:hypothetical protein
MSVYDFDGPFPSSGDSGSYTSRSWDSEEQEKEQEPFYGGYDGPTDWSSGSESGSDSGSGVGSDSGSDTDEKEASEDKGDIDKEESPDFEANSDLSEETDGQGTRNWTSEFQQILSQPDTLEKYTSLATLATDFIGVANLYGRYLFHLFCVPFLGRQFKFSIVRIIISELYVKSKTVVPADLGGVAGGSKV